MYCKQISQNSNKLSQILGNYKEYWEIIKTTGKYQRNVRNTFIVCL